jgi:hypothetical protein
MILAAVWKLKQNGGVYGLSTTFEQTRELAAIDASIQILEFCSQRNSFARRYLIQIKDLRRQITLIQSNESPPSSAPFASSAVSSSASVTDSDPMAENPNFQNLVISSEQSSRPTFGLSGMSSGPGSYSSASPSNINLEGWPSGQFGALSAGNEGTAYGKFSLLTRRFFYIMFLHTLTRGQIPHPPFSSAPMSIITIFSGTEWRRNRSYV